MPTQIQFRRGTTSEHSTFTGAVGELTVDTTKDTLVVHDGATAGGFPLSTPADITTQVNALVDSAPGTLDTLNELAAALGDDVNFSTTVTNSIATKMPLAGGTMTGNLDFSDSVAVRFGASQDLSISHDGSNSYINELGTGNLVIQTNGSMIGLASSSPFEWMVEAETNGAVTLYHDNAAKLATTATGIDVTGTAVTDGVTVDGTLDIEEVYEKVNSSSSTTGTLAYETNAYGVLLLTTAQTANRTINFTNVDANLAAGQSVTCAILATQGSTPYYLNVYQVDGSAVTPKWAGGTAPAEGNASGIDVYSFTIIKTAAATFTVLASLTQYA